MNSLLNLDSVAFVRTTSSTSTPVPAPAAPGRRTARRLLGATCLLLAASSPALAELDGYGRVASGGAGRSVCTVTSGAEQGTGTWDWCVHKGGNQTIQFAVSSAIVYTTSYLESNTTVDGCANGQHGVTLYQPANRHRTVAIQGPVANVVVQCIRFESTGKRPGYDVEEDLLRVDGTAGPVSRVAVSYCTFVSSTDGALDITGRVSDVTASWNLFYGTPLTQLIKYQTRQRISIHHNVYTAGGERNPQIKGDARDLDFVSNVIYSETINKDAVGNTYVPYGTRLWNAAPGSDSPGNVRANLSSNFWGGANGHLQIVTDHGASAAGIYIGPDNVCAGGCPASPARSPNAVGSAYVVTRTPVVCMASQMVGKVGSPNVTTTDTAKLHAVIAALPNDCPALTLAKAGSGRGVVASSPAGISCGSDCAHNFAGGTVVTLEPTPASGSGFAGWSGACSGAGTCRVTMTAARSVTAQFNVLYPLTVDERGGGIVTSSPAGINCGNDCAQSYTAGTVVRLTPTAVSGSGFAGWGGACSGTGTCVVAVSAARSVTATFKVLEMLTVDRAGSGSGSVASSPPGISCGQDCTQRFVSGTVVTLEPRASSGSVFAGWSGACQGTGACRVTVSAAKSVTAGFKLLYGLAVAKAGSGSVTSSPAGISCGSDCAQSYPSGTVVTLSPTPSSGWAFTGWSGACSGTGTCHVTMAAAHSVTAIFKALYTLKVARTGSGTVTSSPAGIGCGSDCAQDYLSGTAVTLSASASPSSIFAGWGGACSGTGACHVTMAAAHSVTATFEVAYPLNVAKAGSGSVTSSPAGISCGSDCTQRFASGTVVTLSPSPASGSIFGGWSGACSGGGTCRVTMAAAHSVTATFKVVYTLSVARAGSGTVTSSPAGIACGADCTQTYASGTLVTLVPSPASGSAFAGWGGSCSGTGTCRVTMSAARSVSASFKSTGHALNIAIAGDGTGNVRSASAGIECGTNCARALTPGSTVALTATADAASTFRGWSGHCSGTGECRLTMDEAKGVTATFASRGSGGFYTLPRSCSVLDTRDPKSASGGRALLAGRSRVFPLVGTCGIPPTARAVSVNLTVVQPTAAGELKLYPADVPAPAASSLSYTAGEARSNGLIVGLSSSGKLAVGCAQASGTAHVLLDVNGYFE